MRAMTRRRRILWIVAAAVGLPLAAAAGWALFWIYYNPRVPPAEPLVLGRAPHGDTITVVMGGDFAPTDAALPLLLKKGYRYPYEATAGLLRDADVSLLNLEAPVTTSDDEFPLYKKYLYKVHPDALAAWTWLGLDVVNLANNHTGDYRDRGLIDTLDHLDAAGIAHVGAGADESEARRPVIFDVGGTRIGILRYLEDKVGYNLYFRAYAVGDRPGCARLLEEDAAEDVARLRPLVDVLIVTVHWGENYAGITGDQEAWAHRLAELGVDVVAGHHAHDVQGAQELGDTLVLYSLGNYAWGAPGHGELRIGFLARLSIAARQRTRPGRVTGLELIPIVTQNRIVNYQPRRLRAEEREWLDPFLRSTRAHGTQVRVEETSEGPVVRLR
jgi:poly-gamma-glutamate capsule biosynthesis protein CapA/YwtB (metallophosphatase superfamily)